nr:RNA-directed DNA polymerase, eukaryota, reverse transcriptase zinc-binding domain protein [Tanacetum cinerariifolium]
MGDDHQVLNTSKTLKKDPSFSSLQSKSGKCSTHFANLRPRILEAIRLSRGHSRGLISVWDPKHFTKEQIWCDDWYIIVKGRWASSDNLFFMINIMGLMRRLIKLPCGIGLLELPLGGRKFTWMNKESTKMIRLERYLISQHVTDMFPDVKVSAFSRGSIVIRKHEVLRKLTDIKDKIDSNTASDIDKEDRVKLLKERDGIQQLEDMDLIQKARVKWDVKGDENTKLFHGILKQKRFYQSIQGIMIDGEWVTNPHQVKSAFYNFFEDKFDVLDSSIKLSPVTPPSTLSQNDNLDLEKPVSDEEIQ